MAEVELLSMRAIGESNAKRSVAAARSSAEAERSFMMHSYSLFLSSVGSGR